MSSGFLGLGFGANPYEQTPMGALQTMASAPGGSPTPPAAPAPAPASPPAATDPATTGSVSAPGGGGALGGIGDVLTNMFSGRGIMGAQPGDDKVDPNTGLTQGDIRQSSMRSMMQMGMLFLAAGQRMSDDARASILAKAPAMLNNSDSLNEMARTRLTMAQLRLAERKEQAEMARTAAVRGFFGGGGLPTGMASGAGASAASVPTPGTIAPITADPATTGAAPAASAPAPAGDASAAPAGAGGGAGDPFAGITPAERAAMAALPPDKALETYLRRRAELNDAETLGQPYVDQTTGSKLADVYKNGRKVRTQDLGKLLGAVSEEEGRRITRTGGVVTGIADVPEDPQDREERAASVRVRQERYTALSGARGQMESLNGQIGRLQSAEEAVRKGNTLAGFGADVKTQALNVLESTGILSATLTAESRNALVDKLVKTGDVNAILGQAGGEFAKQYYGPAISNADVENARKAIGGVITNSPEQVANSIKRIREGYSSKIDAYNRDVDTHNSKLSGIRSGALKEDWTLQKVERAQPQAQAQQYSPEQIAAARAELQRRKAAAGGR